MNGSGMEKGSRRLSSRPFAKNANGWGREKWFVFTLMVLLCAGNALASDAPRSFSLSTSRTFAPGESVKTVWLTGSQLEM